MSDVISNGGFSNAPAYRRSCSCAFSRSPPRDLYAQPRLVTLAVVVGCVAGALVLGQCVPHVLRHPRLPAPRFKQMPPRVRRVLSLVLDSDGIADPPAVLAPAASLARAELIQTDPWKQRRLVVQRGDVGQPTLCDKGRMQRHIPLALGRLQRASRPVRVNVQRPGVGDPFNGHDVLLVRLQKFAEPRTHETQQPRQPPQEAGLSVGGDEKVTRLLDGVGVALAGCSRPLERRDAGERVLVERQLPVALGPGEDRRKLIEIVCDRLRGDAARQPGLLESDDIIGRDPCCVVVPEVTDECGDRPLAIVERFPAFLGLDGPAVEQVFNDHGFRLGLLDDDRKPVKAGLLQSPSHRPIMARTKLSRARAHCSTTRNVVARPATNAGLRMLEGARHWQNHVRTTRLHHRAAPKP